MNAEHLSPVVLKHVLTGEATAEEWQAMVDHLLASCGPCRERAIEVLGELGNLLVEGVPSATVAAAWSPALQAVAEKRLLGSLQWAELIPLAGRQRLARVAGQARFHHHGFVLACWENAERRGRHQPWAGVSIAVLGVAAAERCSGPAEQVAILRFGAFLAWSEALLRADEIPGAARALEQAGHWLKELPNHIHEAAAHAKQHARLAQEIGDFETALELLGMAQELHEILSEGAEVGRVLLTQGRLHGLQRSYRRAVDLAARGLSLLSPETSPRDVLAARVQLAGHLVDDGHPQEALALVESSTDLSQAGGEPERVQRLWVEARIARRLCALSAAVPGFTAVATSFRSLRRQRDHALATLDAAEALQAMGKTGEAAATLRRLAAILKRQGRPPALVSQLVAYAASLNDGRTGELALEEVADDFVRRWHGAPVKPESEEPVEGEAR
jgi:tetratricopeptide (TPR) repeat protein